MENYIDLSENCELQFTRWVPNFQFERTVIGDWGHFGTDWKLVLTQNFVIRLQKADINALLVMIGGILLMIGAKCVQ